MRHFKMTKYVVDLRLLIARKEHRSRGQSYGKIKLEISVFYRFFSEHQKIFDRDFRLQLLIKFYTFSGIQIFDNLIS